MRELGFRYRTVCVGHRYGNKWVRRAVELTDEAVAGLNTKGSNTVRLGKTITEIYYKVPLVL